MERPRFILPSGEIVPKTETSRHHILFESPDYPDGCLRRLRERGGLIIRMANPYHLPQYETALHRHVEPPIVPSHAMARLLLDHCKTLGPIASPYERFEETITYLDYLRTAPSGEIHEQAEQLLDNFNQQAQFIREGRVEYYG